MTAVLTNGERQAGGIMRFDVADLRFEVLALRRSGDRVVSGHRRADGQPTVVKPITAAREPLNSDSCSKERPAIELSSMIIR
jgi:hypothetical protein